MACSRFQWRRGIESLSMGHLPLPSSSTVTVKRREELPPDCPLPPPRPHAPEWGRNVPHWPLSPLLLPSSSSSFLDVRNTSLGNTNSAFLGQLFLYFYCGTFFFCSSCRSSSVTSSASLINFFDSFHCRPCERITFHSPSVVRGQGYLARGPDADRG